MTFALRSSLALISVLSTLCPQYGAFPFREDDIDRARTAKGAERHSLFDCHPDWKHFFGF